MPSTPLSQKVVDKLLRPHERRTAYQDTKSAVTLRVSTTGTGTYYVVGRPKGKSTQSWVKLGRAGTKGISYDRAVSASKGVVAQLEQGIDPTEEVKIQRAEDANSPTLNEVFEAHLEFVKTEINGEPRNRSWKQKQYNYDKYIRPRLGSKKLYKLTEADFQRVYDEIAATAGPTANRVLSIVSVALNQQRVTPNPVVIQGRYKESRSPKRILTTDEIERLMKVLETQTETVRLIVQVCLFTSVRSGNVKSMEWGELDLDRGVWNLPRAKYKCKVDETAALPDIIIDALRERQKTAKQTWVFPSPRYTDKGHVTNINGEWGRIRKAAKIEDVRIHDLRHTCITFLVRDHGTAIAQKQAGHASPKMTAQYTHLTAQDCRPKVNETANNMLKLTQADEPSLDDLEVRLMELQLQIARAKRQGA